ncbi:hypothetical protein LINPERPRIM_LOCUS18472 [Linum perenne]
MRAVVQRVESAGVEVLSSHSSIYSFLPLLPVITSSDIDLLAGGRTPGVGDWSRTPRFSRNPRIGHRSRRRLHMPEGFEYEIVHERRHRKRMGSECNAEELWSFACESVYIVWNYEGEQARLPCSNATPES